MDIIVKVGIIFISLICTSVMLSLSYNALEDIEQARNYVIEQSEQEEKAARMARLATVDYNAVGSLSVDEALDFIFTYASDSTPVFFMGELYTHMYFFSTTGITHSYEVKYIGSLGTTYDVFNFEKRRMMDYESLRNIMVKVPNSRYIVDVNPYGWGDDSTVLVYREGGG